MLMSLVSFQLNLLKFDFHNPQAAELWLYISPDLIHVSL